jgi:short-subunit dehydrogenase
MAAQKVLITGASAGIGKALAYQYASRGASLGLLARRVDLLSEIAADIVARYPEVNVHYEALDVAALETVLPTLQICAAKLGGVDCVIANAGITGVNKTGAGEFNKDVRVIQVNLLGGMATVDGAARIFRQQGHGCIVGISSVSAFRGIPGSAAYSASKAGFSNYLDAVRMELAKYKIKVIAVHPGFIKTDLAPNMEKYPFVIEADKAAAKIVTGIEAGNSNIIVPPLPWRLVSPVLPWLPDKVFAKVF